VRIPKWIRVKRYPTYGGFPLIAGFVFIYRFESLGLACPSSRRGEASHSGERAEPRSVATPPRPATRNRDRSRGLSFLLWGGGRATATAVGVPRRTSGYGCGGRPITKPNSTSCDVVTRLISTCYVESEARSLLPSEDITPRYQMGRTVGPNAVRFRAALVGSGRFAMSRLSFSKRLHSDSTDMFRLLLLRVSDRCVVLSLRRTYGLNQWF